MSNVVSASAVFTPAGTSCALNRVGYGAIKLTGEMAWGPPPDRDAALALLREAVRLGVNHIDTCDYYGPHIANQIICEALHPYPQDLLIATRVGSKRGADKSWPVALSREDIVSAVHDNLRNLRRDVLDVVYLRVGTPFETDENSIAEPFGVLVDLQEQGVIKHIGLSNVSWRQFDESKGLGKVVSVQNRYNVAYRGDDALIDELAQLGTAYVPFHPLGGFRPLKSVVLDAAAASLGVTARQVALSWLLQRSPNILLITGTSSIHHLRDNLKAASLKLPPEIVAQLDEVAPEERPRRPL